MSLKEELAKKVPQEEKNRMEYGMLLAFVRDNKVKDANELKKAINAEIMKCHEWLAKNKPPTATASTEQRTYTRKLECFNAMLSITEKYL